MNMTCIARRDPYDMTLAQIERELAAFDQTPIAQRTPAMVDRAHQLRLAERQVHSGKSQLWR